LLTCGRLVIGLAFRATKERPTTNATRLFGFKLLPKLRAMRRKRNQLKMRAGSAKTQAGRAFGFVKINLPPAGHEVTRQSFTVTYS
jgi:hypothetical protein